MRIQNFGLAAGVRTLLISLTLTSCATTHSGNMAKTVEGDNIDLLSISAINSSPSPDDPFSSSNDPFAIFTITFENKSSDWIRIDGAEVELDAESAKSVSVVVGRDLHDWGEASHERIEKEKNNNQLAQFGMVAIGTLATLAGTNGKNAPLADAGYISAGLGWTWALIDALKTGSNKLNSIDPFPEHHLYNTPFSIPGQMYLRKWVLLNKPPHMKISELRLKLHTLDGRESHVTIKIN